MQRPGARRPELSLELEQNREAEPAQHDRRHGATEDQLIAQDIARARTVDEVDRLSSGFGSGRKAAERLRQRLGLPAVA